MKGKADAGIALSSDFSESIREKMNLILNEVLEKSDMLIMKE